MCVCVCVCVCVDEHTVGQLKAAAGAWLLRCLPGSMGKSSGKSACSRQVGHVLCSFSHDFIHWNTHTHTSVYIPQLPDAQETRAEPDLSVEAVAALQDTHFIWTHVLMTDDARILHVQLRDTHTHTHTHRDTHTHTHTHTHRHTHTYTHVLDIISISLLLHLVMWSEAERAHSTSYVFKTKILHKIWKQHDYNIFSVCDLYAAYGIFLNN